MAVLPMAPRLQADAEILTGTGVEASIFLLVGTLVEVVIQLLQRRCQWAVRQKVLLLERLLQALVDAGAALTRSGSAAAASKTALMRGVQGPSERCQCSYPAQRYAEMLN